MDACINTYIPEIKLPCAHTYAQMRTCMWICMHIIKAYAHTYMDICVTCIHAYMRMHSLPYVHVGEIQVIQTKEPWFIFHTTYIIHAWIHEYMHTRTCLHTFKLEWRRELWSPYAYWHTYICTYMCTHIQDGTASIFRMKARTSLLWSSPRQLWYSGASFSGVSVCAFSCMHACMHVCFNMYVCVCLCVCVCTYIYIYIYIYICRRTCVDVYVYAYKNVLCAYSRTHLVCNSSSQLPPLRVCMYASAHACTYAQL